MREICFAVSTAMHCNHLNTNHVIIWMNVKQFSKILECNRGVCLEAEVWTVMSRCLLTTITTTQNHNYASLAAVSYINCATHSWHTHSLRLMNLPATSNNYMTSNLCFDTAGWEQIVGLQKLCYNYLQIFFSVRKPDPTWNKAVIDISANMTSSTKHKYIMYCNAAREGSSQDQGGHARKILQRSVKWFCRYPSRQTDHNTLHPSRSCQPLLQSLRYTGTHRQTDQATFVETGHIVCYV